MIFFQNRKMWQFFCRMRIKWYYFFEMSFHLMCEAFWVEITKFLKLEKLENMMKKH